MVKGRIVKITLSSSLSGLGLYLSAAETTSTTWASCDNFSVTFLLRVNSAISGGMTIPWSNKGYEPISEIDMAGSFSQVELTQDDGDRNSHVSDIPLQLPASANVSSDSYALVTFEQAEDNLTLFKVSIRCRVRLGQPVAITVPQYLASAFTSSSWASRNFSIGYTTSTRRSGCSVRNGLTCFASSTRIISRCHSSMRSGCEAKSCRCFGNI